MKIFGLNIETKKELKEQISQLNYEVGCLEDDLDLANDEYNYLRHQFPFDLYQVVFDLTLKDAQGKYTKTNPYLEHSTITEVTVTEKNYFKLVKRFESSDIFFTKEAAETYLKLVCR